MAVPITRTVGRPLNILKPQTAWAVEVGEWVQNWMDNNGYIGSKNASFKSRNSLHVVVDNNRKLSILSGADSLKYALAGRTAGGKTTSPVLGISGFPPLGAIIDWIRAKPVTPRDGISENSLAFLIGRKIAEKGTYPPKLRKQNITLVIRQLGIKYQKEIALIQAEEANAEMVSLLTKLPNTEET